MGLLKNVYLDFGFLNPLNLVKKKKKSTVENENVVPVGLYSSSISPGNSYLNNSISEASGEAIGGSGSIGYNLPNIPKKLVEKSESISPPAKIPRELPKLSYGNTKKSIIIEKNIAKPDSLSSISSTEIPGAPIADANFSISETSKQSSITQETQGIIEKQPEKKFNIQPSVATDSFSADMHSDSTFFNSLLSSMEKEKAILYSSGSKDILMKDVFSEVKAFWGNKHYSYKQEIAAKIAEDELSSRIRELHDLELDWQKSQLMHERLKDDVHKKEIAINAKIAQLKCLFFKYHSETNVAPQFFFILSNGSKIRNLLELKNMLHHLPDDIFRYHVNNKKNDFSSWINDVIGLDELASELRYAREKETFIKIIDSYF
ncbi:MAG: hypothetical protein V1859_01995 [archaeon]